LLARRPDLNIVAFRGNVATRLRRLEMGEADATLLAAAGLERLGQTEVGTPIEEMLPAPAQGAVGIEVLASNRRVLALVEAIDHRPTHLCVTAERRLLEGLGGSCRSPVAGLATLDGDTVLLRAEILTNDGTEYEAGQVSFAAGDAEAPLALARHLMSQASPALRNLFAGAVQSS
jgi:hydroxymethylbilane synthase